MRALVFLVFFVAFAVCFGAVLSALPSALSVDRQDYPELFQEWKAYFGKNYPTADEEDRRYANFVMSIERARSRNQIDRSRAHGLTPFSDMSQDEFADRYFMKNNVLDSIRSHAAELANNTVPVPVAIRMANPGRAAILPTLPDNQGGRPRRSPSPRLSASPVVLPSKSSSGRLPNTLYDWGNNGFVSAIKDQQQCGSCWAFSATEQIETNYAQTHGSLPPALSPQQIVDCDPFDGGCNGGWPPSAYQYVQNVGGLETDAAYPYTAMDGQCQDGGNKVARVTGYNLVGQNNENAMLAYLESGGPLSICLDATSLETYAGNNQILQPNSCSPNNINHCVQVTGFLTDANGNIEAYNVRNSWGTWWGNNGYAYLLVGANTCGLTCEPTFVTVA